jgi:hypothetical protein
MHRGKLGLVRLVARVLGQQASAYKHTQDALLNRSEKRFDLGVCGRSGGYERKGAVWVPDEDPVQHERVEMDIEVECTAKALDDRYRPGASLGVTPTLGPLSVETEQGPRVDPKDCAAELVVPSEAIAELEREAQHPLTDWHLREDMVDEVRGALGHAAAATARAEAPAFAGERHEALGATARAHEAGEPVG